MGTFYVNKGRRSWRLIHETYQDGKRIAKQVPREAFNGFGFSINMSIEEAKRRAKELNQKGRLERAKEVEQARRAIRSLIVESVYLPAYLANDFTQHLDDNSFGIAAHKERLQSHWRYVQKMVAKLEIEPKDFYKNANKIYRYFIEDGLSVDYSNKIIRVLNMWGSFVSERSQSFFREVAFPRGSIRERIADNQDTNGVRTKSKPLTPELLEEKRRKLTVPGNYEWLFLSVWLGLRPWEIDSLHDSKSSKVIIVRGITTLGVYQSKLIALPKDQRWKFIPLLTKQQQECLEIIRSGGFKRPLYKTMSAIFDGVTLYGGRIGFLRLMRSFGQQKVNVSKWLGHTNLRRTIEDYEEFDDVQFDPIKKPKAS